jgi:hypothetical protein
MTTALARPFFIATEGGVGLLSLPSTSLPMTQSHATIIYLRSGTFSFLLLRFPQSHELT